jgi:hypothetical protein
MRIFSLILSLFICSIISEAQTTDVTDYFKNNSIVLDSSIQDSNDLIENLTKFDGYFFGEQHKSIGLINNQIKIFDILFKEKKVDFCFLEYPMSFYRLYNYYLNDDISPPILEQTWDTLDGDNRDVRELLKYLHGVNIKPNKFKMLPIDIDNNLRYLSYDIFNLMDFVRALENDTISDGLRHLGITSSRFSSKKRKKIRFIKFKKSVDENQNTYKRYFGKNYSEAYKLIESGVAYVNSDKDMKNSLEHFFLINEYYKSRYREDFMFKNIMNIISDSSIFISFNGNFHIPLNVPEEWVGIKHWESLAYKIKIASPSKKICSIYFMNRNSDFLGGRYFEIEKKMILENMNIGKTYLLKLDGVNSPFKELSEKFQYIVVW